MATPPTDRSGDSSLRYYAAPAELAYSQALPSWMDGKKYELQFGKIIETSRGFRTDVVPLGRQDFDEAGLLEAFRAGADYLKRQGAGTLTIRSHWDPTGAALYTPLHPDSIFISPYSARKNIDYFVQQNSGPAEATFSKEIMAVLAHERVHRDQLFRDPTLGAQARRIAESLRWLENETGRGPLTLERLSAEQVKERLQGVLSVLEVRDPALASSLKSDLERGRLALDFLSERSQVSQVGPSELLELFLNRGLLTWAEHPAHQALLGLQSRDVLKNWRLRCAFFGGIAETFPLEEDAYRVENLVRAEGRKNLWGYIVFSQKYDRGYVAQMAEYQDLSPGFLDTLRPNRLLQGALVLADHRYVVGGFRGLGAVGNSLFILDGLQFADSVQNPARSKTDAALSGAAFLSSSTAGISANAALFTGNLALKSEALRIAGPAGAGAALLASTRRLAEDAERTDVGAAETSLSVLDTAASAVVLGATVALVVGSGGVLIPVLLIAGGVAASAGAQAVHTELTENRVSDTLARALTEFAASPDADHAARIGQILQDPYGELDDDALVDFFSEHVDVTPSLQNSALWKNPLLKPLREKILEELGGDGFFAYQGDEEGAYRMFVALHDSPETAQRVWSELDGSDRKEFENLAKRYGLQVPSF